MKKLTVLAIVCLLLSSVLFSTDYPLGTFSFIGNKEWAYNHRNVFNSYMQQLGYNTSLIELYPASNPIDGTVSSDLAGVFSSMRQYGLKAAIMDKIYSPSDIGSSYAYTTGSYMKFEAEFSNWTQVKLNPDDRYRSDYWYGSREARYMNEQQVVVDTVRVGRSTATPTTIRTSYGYVWQCNAGQDQAGFAYGDLRYRWKGKPSTAGGDSLDIRIGKEFVLKKIDPLETSPSTSDRLYIRYSFKLEGIDSLADNDDILVFSVVGYPYSGGGHTAVPDSLQMSVSINPLGFSGKEYRLTKLAYESLPSHPEYTGYRFLDAEVSYAELAAHNLIRDIKPETPELDTNAWSYNLVNINPRVYWLGNCDLSLDFIEIKDQLYKNIEANPGVYETAIANRLSSLLCPFTNDISHVFSFDEPYPPQFNSYRDLERSPQLTGRTEKQFTAVNVRNFREFPIGIDQSSSDGIKYYNNVDAFINVTNPKYLMVNPYPITPEILWNESTYDENHIQNILDDFVLDKYRDAKVHSDLVEGGEFYACVQAVGRWRDDSWKEYILPPPQTQEMMQYLPLCYGADGIFNYRLFGNVDHPNLTSDEYGALVSVNLGSPIVNPPTFNALQTANGKIQKYGPLITDLEWKGSNTILQSSTNPFVETSSLYITGIANANSTLTGPYGCYVQAGYFRDRFNNPSIMLVNRRANYFNSNGQGNPKDVSISNYSACYPAFDSQKVTVSLSESATAQFGDYVALYDVASDSLYFEEGLDRTILLEPGEGIYLQMCGTLPAVVTESVSLQHKSFISGEVTLSPSTIVDFLSNSNITILPKTHITLSSGAVLNLAGTITIGDSVRFSIADQALVNIAEANCEIIGALFIDGNGHFNVADSTNSTYFENSRIHISNGAEASLSGVHTYHRASQVIVTNQSELRFEHTQFNLRSNVQFIADSSMLSFNHSSFSQGNVDRDSIIVRNNSRIDICSSSIRKAPIRVVDSDLYMENSYIRSGNGEIGITVSNHNNGRSVQVVSNNGRNGFSALYPNCNIGILVEASRDPIIIRDSDFTNYYCGIQKNTNSVLVDSIFACTFDNCENGIQETSSGSGGRIENCEFSNIEYTGISLIGSIPIISACSFNACGTGIFFDGTYYSPLGSGLYNSSFSYCDTAIESRNSNPRVESCSFDMNEIGLLCHNDSNMNLAHNAYNHLSNLNSNIKFYWDDMYHSYIQLLDGHNDFYHFGANTFDFEFDSNYASSTGYAIDASKNWFEGDSLSINDQDYLDYVKVSDYDPEPNTLGTDPDGGNRYLLALHQEATGQFDQAISQYQAIIDEQIPEEKPYYNGCIDGIYRVKILQEAQWAFLAQYINEKITQYSEIDSSYTKLLNGYLVKTHIARKDYQSAIDLIQVRIANPSSPIDSLRAVLDLEIVLQLAAMDVAKKPISTNYVQYKFANVSAFRTNHERHLELLYELLQNDGTPEVNIPIVPMISNNYPNPFNPSTTIVYSIPQTGRVKLSIFNLRGQKVKTLLDSDIERGQHRVVWEGRDDGNRSVASGVYFIRLEAAGKTNIRKAMLLK